MKFRDDEFAYFSPFLLNFEYNEFSAITSDPSPQVVPHIEGLLYFENNLLPHILIRNLP